MRLGSASRLRPAHEKADVRAYRAKCIDSNDELQVRKTDPTESNKKKKEKAKQSWSSVKRSGVETRDPPSLATRTRDRYHGDSSSPKQKSKVQKMLHKTSYRDGIAPCSNNVRKKKGGVVGTGKVCPESRDEMTLIFSYHQH
jgi:hypothetical protein